MNAWLITWESTKPISPTYRIAGVLSSRTSIADIETLVDFIYHRTIFNVGEAAHYSNKKKARQTKSKMLCSKTGRIFYGSNPFLFARKVRELKVTPDEARNLEVVSWVELAVIENNESTGYSFKETEPEKTVSVSRPVSSPLVVEPQNA